MTSDCEPALPTIEQAVLAHEIVLAQTGGAAGTRDMSLPESALARGQNAIAYRGADAVAAIAAIVYGIARNHAFVDGNKRTAYAVGVGALALNGLRFDPPAEIVDIMVELAAGSLDEARFEAILRSSVTPDPELALTP